MKTIKIEVSNEYYERYGKRIIERAKKGNVKLQKIMEFKEPLEKLLKNKFENLSHIELNDKEYRIIFVSKGQKDIKEILKYIITNELYNEYLEYRVIGKGYFIFNEIETDGIEDLDEISQILAAEIAEELEVEE